MQVRVIAVSNRPWRMLVDADLMTMAIWFDAFLWSATVSLVGSLWAVCDMSGVPPDSFSCKQTSSCGKLYFSLLHCS
jgi:hypothetical protein